MPSPEDEALDPEAARVLSRVRRLMGISVAFTGIAIVAVLLVVGYRIFKSADERTPAPQVNASLPQGARVISTALGEGRLAVTIEAAGRTEVHLYDVHTLAPRGRLTLTPAP